MGKKHRTFSAEFKFQVVVEALQGFKTINEIASMYEVHPGQVSQWKREFLDSGSQVFQKKRDRDVASLEAEKEKLHQKIGQLTVEVDWLKKKVAPFVSSTEKPLGE